jgi:tripartite-type tricarboxylate transporter receptor subunit TctC
MLPPNTAAPILATWREAFNKTMQDKGFLAEAQKAKLYVQPVTGNEIEKSVAKIQAITPRAKEFLQETIVKNMKKS